MTNKRQSSKNSRIRQIIYALQNVFNYFRQNFFSSLLTILVIAISLSLPIVFYIFWKSSAEISSRWYPAPNISVYLQKGLSENENQNIAKKIEQLAFVKRIIYLNEDEALDEFLSWSGLSESATYLDKNPLPAVIIVYPNAEGTSSSENLSQLQKNLQTIDGVDEAKVDQTWFNHLLVITKMIGKITITLAILMILAIFLIVSNSIRLTIASRLPTIQIMQLIGATERFILRPFLYNGALYGIFSALIAIFISQIFFWQLQHFINQTTESLSFHFQLKQLNFNEIIVIILLSTIIGWISAWISTRNFLNSQKNKTILIK